jgi:hypothetical protein
MKRLVLIAVALLTFGANAQNAVYKVKTSRIAFANETAAKTDTLATLDSAFCVISPLAMGGVLPDKIQIHLPNVMGSGDSALVFLQLYPNDKGGNVNNTDDPIVGGLNKVGDNVRVTDYTLGTDVYASIRIGTWYYGQGAKTLTISPPDSAATHRVGIVFVETAGAPVITGMQKLATTPIYMSKIYQAR